MKKCSSIFVMIGFLVACFSLPAVAQERSTTIAADAKFLLDLNVEGILNSSIGKKVGDIVKKKAAEELGKNKEKGMDYDKVVKMIGFDPFTELRSVSVSSSDFESPETSFVATIRLRKTAGNLEGLLLSAPGYESSDYGKHQIHSVKLDDKTPWYAAFHGTADNEKSILVSARKDLVTQLLDQLDGKKGTGDSTRIVQWESSVKDLLQLQVLQLPKSLETGPQANVSKLLKSLGLRILDAGANVDIMLDVTTDTEKHAEQVRQMAQGAVAMFELAQSFDDENKEMEKVLKFLKNLKTERKGSDVHASLSVPMESLDGIIDIDWDDN